MSFYQFFLTVMALYTCYYLLLFLYDRLLFRQSGNVNAYTIEFIIPEHPPPIKVIPPTAAPYQMEEDAPFEEAEQRNHLEAPVSMNDEFYDIALETIVPTGIPVSSSKFADWLLTDQ